MSTDLVALPDLVPARMVNEYVYCPRLAYLEWVQGDWADNADTAEGRFRHRVVDQETGDLPDPARPADDPESPAPAADASSAIHARSVWMSAPEEWLTARIDLLEGEATPGAAPSLTPVDYKRGSPPDLPEGAWESDRVQLCAQGLILRANGYACAGGVIYYAETRTRVPVAFDDALVARTRQIVQEARRMAAGPIPPPLVGSPKCVRCSLAPLCLPDETNLLADRQPDGEEGEVRRLMPARDDALPLYVQQQGARVGRSGELFEVRLNDCLLAQARIFETSHIALFGSVQITTQALSAALDAGIPVAYFSTGGWFKGLAHGPAHKNVLLRMAQYRAAFDAERSLALARAFVSAKIRNGRTLLMRNHADPPPDVIDALAQLARQAQTAAALPHLLSVEGQAARLYFGAFSGMLKPRPAAQDAPPAWTFDFNSRNRRPPRDPVNAMLSYAYTLLVKELTVLAQVIGFDPHLGFYHQPRYGRPSLALDVMEEFRPLIADSVVLTVVNTGVITPDDFIRRGPAAALKDAARKRFIRAWETRLDTLVTHPVFGYRVSYRRVLEVQVRLLGRLLNGEIQDYPAFVTR